MTPAAMSGTMFGIGAASAVISGFGQYESGQSQRSAYDYNADITLENMRNQIAANQQQFAGLVGRQASGYAASGVDIASGSPLLIMAATAARGGKQAEQLREAGTEEAALQRYYGHIAAWTGTNQGIGTFLSGLSKAATGYYGATGTVSPSAGLDSSTGDES